MAEPVANRCTSTVRRCFAVLLSAASMSVVLGSTPEPCLALPFHASPDSTGIVAVDFEFYLPEDCPDPVAAILYSSWGKTDCTPSLALAGWPCPEVRSRTAPCHFLISAWKQDKMYYFADLPPGRYQLIRFTGTVVKPEFAGSASGGLLSLIYECQGESGRLLSVDVTAGSATYLGWVGLVDASYPREGVFAPKPAVVARLVRRSELAGRALQSLRKAAGRTEWGTRLQAITEAEFVGPPIDTVWAWPKNGIKSFW